MGIGRVQWWIQKGSSGGRSSPGFGVAFRGHHMASAAFHPGDCWEPGRMCVVVSAIRGLHVSWGNRDIGEEARRLCI